MARTTRSPLVQLQPLRASLATAGRRIRVETAGGRLRGRTLVVARVLWLAVAVLTGGLYAAGVWVRLRDLQGPCPSGVCQHSHVPLAVARAFADLHLSVGFYGWYTLGRNVLFASGFAAIAALLFWRRSRDPLALYVSLTLVLFGVGSFENVLAGLPAVSPGWWLPVALLGFLGEIAFGIFVAVFPDGRFVPGWTRLAVVALVLWWLPNSFFPGSPLDFTTWPGVAYLVGWAALLGMMGTAQVYRYRRVSAPAQQQQTKWVVFGFVAAGIGYFGGRLIVFFLAPALTSPRAVLADLAGFTLTYVSILLIPLCIGIAMLRYHLFDIDLIIRRTLVYGTLTVTLALVYVVGVVVLHLVVQTLIHGLAGHDTPLALVGSTLAIVALFESLRTRIQTFIDRRFYRRKYDAARTLAAFSATLRNEVDLRRLREDLLAVVQETMQPVHASLWLRASSPGSPNTPARPLEPAAAWTNRQARADSAELR